MDEPHIREMPGQLGGSEAVRVRLELPNGRGQPRDPGSPAWRSEGKLSCRMYKKRSMRNYL